MPRARLFRFEVPDQEPAVHFAPPARQHGHLSLLFTALTIQVIVSKVDSRPVLSSGTKTLHQNGEKEGQHPYPKPLGRGTHTECCAERHVGPRL